MYKVNASLYSKTRDTKRPILTSRYPNTKKNNGALFLNAENGNLKAVFGLRLDFVTSGSKNCSKLTNKTELQY